MKFDGISPMKSDSNLSGCSVSRGATKDRVVINVGGYRHETYLSTLRVVPDSRLAWIGESASKQAEYDPETNEVFFDRHPGVFVNILNYYRTGKLHCPGDVCGPLFEEELAFWGIEELQMEPCCWSNYTQHRDAQATLKAFEGLKKENDDSECEHSNMLGGEMQSRPRKSRVRMRQMWALLEQPYSSKYAQILAMVSLLIIILSVTTFCIESIPEFKGSPLFYYLEFLYCAWFTIEFVARTIACPNKLVYLKNFMTWVDILSVIPLYVSFTKIEENLDFLFVIRLVRIFRLFRFFRTMSGMQVIGHTLRASARELFLLVLILLIPMVIFSTLVFYAERGYQKNRNTFNSIPDAFWWAIITMTTVGYGDVVPRTTIGKMIGTICACIGVLIVALPVSVIGSNFTLFYSHAQAQLKLPKKKSKPLLLGAAGVLVSETTLNNDDDDSQFGNEDGDTLKPNSLQPRLSTSEFKHLRNPSIIPRARNARRQGRGTIDIPAFSFPRMSKIESDLSDTESNKNTRNQALSPDTSGSMTNISNGLRGISEVMLQITAPVTRRMAISPCPTPPNKRGGRKKRRLKRSLSGNEESSGCERESFYTTDADSATEGNNHQLALEELKEKMRAHAQAQHSISDSSNCNPLSSKENITSGEENPQSPQNHSSPKGPNYKHLTNPKQLIKSSSHISLDAITVKPGAIDTGRGTQIHPPEKENSSKGSDNEPLRNPNSKLEQLSITIGPVVDDPGRGEDQSCPPNISDKQMEPDTWVKQPKSSRTRSRGHNCRRRSPIFGDKGLGDFRSYTTPPDTTSSPVNTPEGEGLRLSCNGSFNELKVHNAIGLNHRRTSSEMNVACGHGLSKASSVSKSLDRIGASTCRRVNDQKSSSSEFGSETRRVQFIHNTVV